jgi:hypothetical protein
VTDPTDKTDGVAGGGTIQARTGQAVWAKPAEDRAQDHRRNGVWQGQGNLGAAIAVNAKEQ